MKEAKDLKAFLEKAAKRSDINIHFFDLPKGVDKTTLAKYKGLFPNDLLEFYKVMNGCHFYATFVNDSNLQIGINFPAIEDIKGFEEASWQYDFKKPVKLLAFEWIEGQYSPFFYLLEDDGTKPDAAPVYRVTTAPFASEFVAGTLGEWIKMSIEAGLALGWAYKDEEFKERALLIKDLMAKEPEKRTVLLPGTRVLKKDQLMRATVLKQVQTQTMGYHGNDYVLIQPDIAPNEKYWVVTGTLGTRTQ
jgi:hypothetical protein